MEFLFVLLLVITAVVIYKISSLSEKLDLSQSKQNKHPYFKNSALLTPAEISFRHTLKIAVGDSYQINSKVRLADLISVHKGLAKSEWSSSFNQIKAKHIDFVLVDDETTEILCAIELDDSSHNKQNREDRDNFLDAALKNANLPLLRFRTNHAYKSKEISDAIYTVLNAGSQDSLPLSHDIDELKVKIEPDFDTRTFNESTGMKCPKCHAELVERQASKGRHAGVKFLGCSNFPACRYRKVIG